jgi:oxalate decarboxylase/phosphoglucose isomerase-like protein (cupin superfamily)
LIKEHTMSELSRRQIIGTTALAACGLASVGRAEPAHKEEALPTFRYPMEQQQGRVTEGGSAKEATIKQLPLSTGLAGVSMRLKPGGIRELHWHANAAEWAFVLKGRVRTTVIGPDSLAATDDFEPGDVWYFPRGHGHAIQNLTQEEAHFILVFDNGAFSEYGTFSITDWLGHTPVSVVAKGLGLAETELGHLPRDERYILRGRIPPEQPEPNRFRAPPGAVGTEDDPLRSPHRAAHSVHGGGPRPAARARSRFAACSGRTWPAPPGNTGGAAEAMMFLIFHAAWLLCALPMLSTTIQLSLASISATSGVGMSPPPTVKSVLWGSFASIWSNIVCNSTFVSACKPRHMAIPDASVLMRSLSFSE